VCKCRASRAEGVRLARISKHAQRKNFAATRLRSKIPRDQEMPMKCWFMRRRVTRCDAKGERIAHRSFAFLRAL
jgi:hypothetical protein